MVVIVVINCTPFLHSLLSKGKKMQGPGKREASPYSRSTQASSSGDLTSKGTVSRVPFHSTYIVYDIQYIVLLIYIYMYIYIYTYTYMCIFIQIYVYSIGPLISEIFLC